MIHRKFVGVDGLSLHFRVRGGPGKDAPSLVLLHPSPMSSAIFVPLMEALPQDIHVVALDTPGYGLSDPLPSPATQIADYLPTLKRFIEAAIGDTSFALYGSATGAQLALGFSYTFPERVRHLFLDNAAHFDEVERQHILQRYFIDLTPRTDGAHLQALWAHARQMLQYFPWYEADEAHRIRTTEPSVDEITQLAAHFLAAGPRYAEAYRAAFCHESIENYQRLTTPTTLFRWLGSPLLPQINALLAHPLPACIRSLDTPAPPAARLETMSRHIAATMHK
jgi:pimeloyl-ACP methyl ester carboxylesterase